MVIRRVDLRYSIVEDRDIARQCSPAGAVAASLHELMILGESFTAARIWSWGGDERPRRSASRCAPAISQRVNTLREALSMQELVRLYGRIARRYDLQHALITARADQRGRRLLVGKSVRDGDGVLDCGAGTGSAGILAARAAGPDGSVTLLDLSEAMLAVAREKAQREGLLDRLTFLAGDMVHLPFGDASFDVVLSTYSLCPIYDPVAAALEMYRVARPGGRIAAAHSTTPRNPLVKSLANRLEDFAWRFPWLSMGCRSVSVMPALEAAGAKVAFAKRIGFPLWPFLVFIAEKPAV